MAMCLLCVLCGGVDLLCFCLLTSDLRLIANAGGELPGLVLYDVGCLVLRPRYLLGREECLQNSKLESLSPPSFLRYLAPLSALAS